MLSKLKKIHFERQQIKLALLWAVPTGLEVFVYIFVAIVTVTVCNLSFFKQSLFIPNNLNPYNSTLDSINQLVQKIFGERIAGSLSLGIFWGLVGMIVYVIIWLLQNFSTELNNDLAMTKYIVPRGGDPESPIRSFLSLSLFRFMILLLFIFYVNLVFRALLPRWLQHYQGLTHNWPHSRYMWGAVFSMIGQIITLHGFVVFTRLLFLRKRIFG
ncbi:MAG: hypothetical protein JWS12_708 [Candidatus Saccharibacteria bacterium]|nr:hypothetical protein [Candidatus Saccharibacteria bacterium]